MEPLFAAAPNPEASREFVEHIRSARLTASPLALRCAVGLASYSPFLAGWVRQDPELLLKAADPSTFYRLLTVEDYQERLEKFLRKRRGHYGHFRRTELLRILLRDVLGAAALANVTEELSNLADAILDSAYRHGRASLTQRHGEPRLADGSLCGFSVISVGKLGGKELNYSSDIDLIA